MDLDLRFYDHPDSNTCEYPDGYLDGYFYLNPNRYPNKYPGDAHLDRYPYNHGDDHQHPDSDVHPYSGHTHLDDDPFIYRDFHPDARRYSHELLDDHGHLHAIPHPDEYPRYTDFDLEPLRYSYRFPDPLLDPQFQAHRLTGCHFHSGSRLLERNREYFR